jgi:hypothetical protein
VARWGSFRGLKRGSKYGNVPMRVDGRLFHSQKEARRYQELKAMESCGLISGLECQVRYHLEVGKVRICDYIADFRYQRDGAEVVEDVKGMRTREYELKARLMLACLGIEVLET